MRSYPIRLYERWNKSTYPDKDGNYLILLRDSDISLTFWAVSGWCSMGGYFDYELDSGEHDTFYDPNIEVFCYMQLPEISTVLSILEKGEVYNG